MSHRSNRREYLGGRDEDHEILVMVAVVVRLETIGKQEQKGGLKSEIRLFIQNMMV